MTDILAIVGSTRFACPRGLTIVRHLVAEELQVRRPNVVTSGGAEGVDTIGAEYAERAGIRTLIFPPTVRQWAGPGGFRERNQRIADTCTRALRVVCGSSRTYGSGWTCDRVREQGKAVRTVVVYADGAVVDSGWPVPVTQPHLYGENK